jgi:TfoX/Sxy family transcriptional regulator of competence genes
MAAKKEYEHAHPDKVKLYEKLVAAFPELELKGATMPYTSFNGNMFSFISKEGLVGIRLPKEEREAFLKKYKTELFKTQGTVLKEYVTVPENLLANTKELKKYFAVSFGFVKTLKPKPAAKKKK